MSQITFDNVTKRHDSGICAVKNISLEINRGELVFVCGPSGAGKTTLLRMIAGIERPTEGALMVNDYDISNITPAEIPFLRRNLGLILQRQPVLPSKTLLENVMLPMVVAGEDEDEARERAAAALERLGLSGRMNFLPEQVSEGEQQRAAVARAIVNRPQIILADEPTANLDADNARLVVDALASFISAGVTCIVATHDTRLLQDAPRIVYLNAGRLTHDTSLEKDKTHELVI